MALLDEILADSASTAFKALLLVIFMVAIGGVISLGLWLSLLPQLAVCGESVISCVMVLVAIVFLALIAPLIMLWCARGYVLIKVLYQLYKLYEAPILERCAEQICKHRSTILAAGKLNHSRLSNQIPLPVRLIIGRLDLKPLIELLKNNPALTPAELVIPLKTRIKAQAIIQKPSVAWFAILLMAMFLVASLTWWLV